MHNRSTILSSCAYTRLLHSSPYIWNTIYIYVYIYIYIVFQTNACVSYVDVSWCASLCHNHIVCNLLLNIFLYKQMNVYHDLLDISCDISEWGLCHNYILCDHYTNYIYIYIYSPSCFMLYGLYNSSRIRDFLQPVSGWLFWSNDELLSSRNI